MFTDHLGVGFAVRIEKLLTALLPGGLHFRRSDVPVAPAFPGNGAQVLAEILHRGPAPEPIAIVDLVDDKTGLKDDHVRDHRIVERIGVLGDV